MTKGVLAPRGSDEQLKLYHEALEICNQIYGEFSLLASRLSINIGIVYEDNGDYVRAFHYFTQWAQISEVVLGSKHPKTQRSKNVLQEERYQLVAKRLKEQARTGGVVTSQESLVNNDASCSRKPAGGAAVVASCRDPDAINREVDGLVYRCNARDSNRRADADWSDDDGQTDASNSYDMHEQLLGNSDGALLNDELQRAINDLLRNAIGQLDSRAQTLQNLIQNMSLVPPQRGSGNRRGNLGSGTGDNTVNLPSHPSQERPTEAEEEEEPLENESVNMPAAANRD